MSTLTDAAAGELRAHLGREDLTIAAAAALVGVSPTWLSRRLSGAISPTLAEVEQICAGLNVPVGLIIRERVA